MSWHIHLGHPSDMVVNKFLGQSSLDVKDSDKSLWIVYLRAKQTRESFPISNSCASGIFEIIYYDLWGSYKVMSTIGASYFLTILDDCSRAVWIFLSAEKTEVFTILKNYVIWLRPNLIKLLKLFEVILELGFFV